MRDPYLFEDVNVLRNKLNIRNAEELTEAEANITYLLFLDIDKAFEDKPFDLQRLCGIHRYILGNLFDWAGQLRSIPMVKGEPVLGGDTVRYSPPDRIAEDASKVIAQLNQIDWAVLNAEEIAGLFARLIAALWQVHPFREGNTRSVITFATQFAAAHGFAMDKNLLRENAEYVRGTLVKASDGQYAEYQYLQQIFKDAILQG
ncbi:MAG: Fic family protein [Oscillospiraceae bacterium]|jgi:cell filamentation protein|nr:Fic family protein [Oscillospiraceae bacterium]